MASLSPAVQQMARRLQGLSAEEERILGLRFALDGTRNHNLDEIATSLRTTRDEVRRIEVDALQRLSGEI